MKQKINELVPPMINYSSILMKYFMELINVMDIKTGDISKSIKSKKMIIEKIIPELLEFIPEFNRYQFINFFNQTFKEFNIDITEEDLSDVFKAIKRFEVKRDNIISRSKSQNNDIEVMDELIKMLNNIENISDDEITALSKLYFDLNVNDPKSNVIAKLNGIKNFIQSNMIKLNFEEIYNNPDVEILFDFIDKNTPSKFNNIKNKSLSKILLRRGINIKSNVSLKGLFDENDTETIHLNRKRLLLVVIELFTQLYFPNALKTGMNFIEKNIRQNFLQEKSKAEIEQDLKMIDKSKFQNSKSITLSNTNLKLKKIKLLSTDSSGLFEFYIPTKQKFVSVNPIDRVDYDGETFESRDFIRKFEKNEIPMEEESWILYMECRGVTAKEFFRYSIEKDVIPNDTESKIHIFRQLLKLEGQNFIEIKNKDVDLTAVDIIPEFYAYITETELNRGLSQFM